MPKAFVIMPFDAEMNSVYELYITPTLVDCGFEVTRADNIVGSRNILDDVIAGISDAALVVADLTGGNENVFYEVGIAHTLLRPTILLTQQLDELPFDLRPYRVIAYSTHFAQINDAKKVLTDFATAAISEPEKFANPVQDYFARIGRKPISSATIEPAKPELSPVFSRPQGTADDELGLFDFEDQMTDRLARLGEIITGINSEFTSLSEKTSEQISDGIDPNASAKTKIAYLRRYSDILSSLSAKLETANSDYRTEISEIGNLIEGIYNFASKSGRKEDIPSLKDFVTVMGNLEGQVSEARAGVSELESVIDKLPNFQKDFNRARQRLKSEISEFLNNLTLTVSIAERAKNRGLDVIERLAQAYC